MESFIIEEKSQKINRHDDMGQRRIRNPIADHIEYPEADAGYCHRTGILYLNKKEKAFFSKILDDAIGDHHDPEMQKIMTDYHLAIDRDIKLMVNDVMNNRDTLPITVGFVDTRMARDIEKMTGLKTTGNRIILRASDIRHILKRHGENGTADHSMKDIDDIARMSYVLENYDEIRNENRSARQYRTKTGKAAPQLLVSKKVDGRYYVVEVIMDGENRKNAVSTAYLQNRNE